tara:strand:- start:1196 stop:1798 length:603 start_codon:yes stop_codon:yes gene_type:complete
MACDITRGRKIDCKSGIGGLKAIYLAKAFSSNVLQKATIANTEMTEADWENWTAGDATNYTVFKYELVHNLSSMTVNVNSDNATGTAFFSQTLSVTLQQIDHDMTNELRLIAYARPQIFVQDSMDKVYMLGAENGCHVTGGTVVTGAAMGDMQGYTLEWGADEKDAFIQLPIASDSTATDFPFSGLPAGDITALIITEGS